jgi:hypothetical protein
MSRDGYLPPGCTEKDVDEAAPGYWDEPMEWQNDQQRAEWEEAQQRKDEAETRLREIEENFRWLCATGYQTEALAKWEELGIALRWLRLSK